MSTPDKRYDTLVICGATSNVVPREAAGGEVVAWSAGHALAEHWPLETFVQELADGCYEDEDMDTIQAKASVALELSRRQRDHGWLNNEEKNNG
ncbi:MAG: hypothetical protein U5M72_00245 [Pseudomonas sp.]|nr:hypothetical protein [Pseudomonas sp.]